MPIHCRLDTDGRVVKTTMRGAITIEELRHYIATLDALDGHRYCELVDARDAAPAFNAKELPGLAEEGKRTFGDRGIAPRAVVVRENDLVLFGLTRIFAALVASWMTIRVFDNLAAAEAYLDAPRIDRASSA